MTLIHLYDKGLTPFQQLLGYNEEIQSHWLQLGEAVEKDGHLSAHLKEEVRKTLAQKNGCHYCQAKGIPDPQHYDEKTAVCTGFAEAFLVTKGHTAPYVTAVLKEYLTEAEISELLAFICFTTAQQYFGALMQLK
ncbi:carboxymuconolactone decarboxylase family protein [Lysinibacillus fusiformis]|uniref:carboxymuconolactone decarboxylase family protein n=1 Tax=Lysinibacillus fusiformis TaxID=28031 RepID=UPI00215A3577|nr:carboxymuconolactone decarboxylase family protein [Lysinibacillus fusiformis]MCR8853719.1 carboxymuconolactone decarboxylase family protein [Lysinibacillus fusiformis]WKT76316.1 carboxymuconolactone decarboxylase family protein [Lysinibacillus fusiformis]WKT79883.1 carboxymuconolactone decarboxylase family protein [Lysinibacillus fusiformis]